MPEGKRCGGDSEVCACLFTCISVGGGGGAHGDGKALCTAVTGREAGCHFTCGPGQGNIVRNTMNGRDTKK